MSKRKNVDFISDIREAINSIELYTHKIGFDVFLSDKKTQDAVVRNLEIIGEAVKNLSRDFIEKYKDIEWKSIAGLRDKVIHFYFGVNWDIVWDVIEKKLPELKEKIDLILRENNA